MQEACDLPLQLGRLREVGKGRRAFEKFSLDFGRESAPSHHDCRSETVQNMLVFVGILIDIEGWRPGPPL